MLQVAPEHTAITTVGKKLENADLFVEMYLQWCNVFLRLHFFSWISVHFIFQECKNRM